MNACLKVRPARSFTCFLTVLLAMSPGVSNAIDETDSFALLVETLESSDEPCDWLGI